MSESRSSTSESQLDALFANRDGELFPVQREINRATPSLSTTTTKTHLVVRFPHFFERGREIGIDLLERGRQRLALGQDVLARLPQRVSPLVDLTRVQHVVTDPLVDVAFVPPREPHPVVRLPPFRLADRDDFGAVRVLEPVDRRSTVDDARDEVVRHGAIVPPRVVREDRVAEFLPHHERPHVVHHLGREPVCAFLRDEGKRVRAPPLMEKRERERTKRI